MDAGQVKVFTDTAAQLLVQVGEYTGIEPAQRKPADDALVRQLRVSVAALANALVEVARMTPPPMPPMPPVQVMTPMAAPPPEQPRS